MFRPLPLIIGLFCAESDSVQPLFMETMPAAKVAAPRKHHADLAESDIATGDVEAILQRWAAASKHQEIPPQSQRENLRLQFSRTLNGHAAIAVEKFVGQVESRQLRGLFDWRIVESNEQEICLEATPKDDTDLLFYRSIRLWLKPSNAHLIRIQATDRQGQNTASWTVPEMTMVASVTADSLDDDGVPSSPLRSTDGQVANREPTNESPANSPAKNSRIRQASARLDVRPTSAGESDSQGFRRPASVVAALPERESADDKISPELNEILNKWAAASSKVKTAKIQFTRTIYNLVFEEERVAKGELIFAAPDKVSLKLRSETIPKGARSHRAGKAGTPFRVVGDHGETMIWNTRELVWMNDEDKTFEIIPIPENFDFAAGSWFRIDLMSLQLPIVRDIHAEQLRREWSWTLSKSAKESVVLIAVPRIDAVRQRCAQCFVIVDRATWQTAALKILDPAGSMEIVYKFEDRQINQELPRNWLTPDFKQLSYKQVGLPKDN